jgi:cytochrome b561
MSSPAPVRTQHHDPLAKAFHWLTAVLVVAQVTLALRAWKLPPGAIKNALLGQHMSVGLCVLTLTLLRLF